MPNDIANLASIQVSNGLAQCPVCQRWVRIVREIDLTVYHSCEHYIGVWETDGRMYVQFMRGERTCASKTG